MKQQIDTGAYRYVDFVQSRMHGTATIDTTLLENFA
jgi:hypothetical protein